MIPAADRTAESSPQRRPDSTTQASDLTGGEDPADGLRHDGPTVGLDAGGSGDAVQDHGTLLSSLDSAERSRGSFATDPLATGITPQQIGRFRIIRELGRGGFGVVYLAFDPKLGRRIALKLPRPEVLFTPNMRSRLLREAQAAAVLDHPHIAPLFETGEIGDVCYLVSPYCEGGTVADYMAERSEAFPVRRAAQLVLRLARAVHYAHTRGILHRDIKPANVLLDTKTSSERAVEPELPFIPRLTDFGLARFLAMECEDDADPAEPGLPESGSMATCTGALLGTPRYMAPEQIEGQPASIGPATDVYGLGALLYELLAGEPVFSGGGKAEALRRVLLDTPTPLRRVRREVPADLEAICLRCLEKQPERRYASAAALEEDLQRFLRGQPTIARPLNLRQRTAQWIRREPAWAALLGTVAVTLFGIIGGLTAYNARLGSYAAALQGALEREQQQAHLANQQRLLADQRELESREHAYVSDAWRAWRMWQSGEGNHMCDLLRRSTPAAGQSDLREFAWGYLWALGSNLSDLRGHVGNVHGIRFSPDNQTCASWSFDPTDRSVRLWDVHSRGQKLVVTPPGPPRTVGFSADSTEFVSVDELGYVCRWSASDGRQISSHRNPELHCEPAKPYPKIALAQDARLLGYATADSPESALRMWDLDSGEIRTTREAVPRRISAVALSEDATLLATASDEPAASHPVRIFRVETGEVVRTFAQLKSPATGLEFSSDGQRLAAATSSAPVLARVWDLKSGQGSTFQWGGPKARPSLSFSPQGNWLAVGREDLPRPGVHDGPPADKVRIWNVDTAALVAEPPTSSQRVMSTRFSPDGQLLGISGGNGLLRLWNRQPHETVQTISAHSSETWDVTFSPDSSLLATVSDDETCKIWDAASGAERARLVGHPALVTAVAFSPDGARIATSCFDGRIHIWEADSGLLQRAIEGHAGPVRCLAIRGDGKLVASGADDRTIKLWDVETGQHRATLEGHLDKLRDLAFQPGSDLLVAADNHGFVTLWDTNRHKVLDHWQHASEVQSLAITPDGKLLAAGSLEGQIRLYELPEGHLTRVLSAPIDGAHALAFSPDGRTLAAGGKMPWSRCGT